MKGKSCGSGSGKYGKMKNSSSSMVDAIKAEKAKRKKAPAKKSK